MRGTALGEPLVKEILFPGLKDSECMPSSTHNRNDVLKMSDETFAVFSSMTNDF